MLYKEKQFTFNSLINTYSGTMHSFFRAIFMILDISEDINKQSIY